MKEVYLTKIERKTIFTKSLIYVLVMFVISDLTQTGPFYVNFIPWLFILGILASIKGIDKILTCIIGGFTVFVSCIITENGMNMVVMWHTLSALLQLVFGIIAGKIFYEFILEHRLVKYIRASKKTLYISLIVVLAVISIGICSILYGDIYSYVVSRKNLDKYISKTYMVEEYNVKEVKYNKKAIGNYVYKVEISETEIYLYPVTKTEFNEINKKDRINKLEDKLNQEYFNVVDKVMKDSLVEFLEVDKEDISFRLDYSKALLNPDKVIMTFDVDTENIDEAIKEVVYIINNVKDMDVTTKITDVILNINNKVMNIKLEDVVVTKEYISNGLNTLDLDE